jgi:hypothetical protein
MIDDDDDDDESGAVDRMRIGRGNRSTRRKPAPVLLCPPQIPHDLTWARTGAAVFTQNNLLLEFIIATLHVYSLLQYSTSNVMFYAQMVE